MRKDTVTEIRRLSQEREKAILAFEAARSERVGEVEILWGANWDGAGYRPFLRTKGGEISTAVLARLGELRTALDKWERCECDFPKPKE